MKLKYMPTVGRRIVELADGSAVYMEHNDEFDFEPELAQKLMLDGTFSVVELGDWEEELLEEPDQHADSITGDITDTNAEGPAAEQKLED